MDKDIKDKWIAALRSEKYKQGQGTLRDGNDNYCCLGVLCDVMGLPFQLYNERFYLVNGYGALLPTETHIAAQLTAEQTDRLMTMNDAEKRSFSEIADYIEEKL